MTWVPLEKAAGQSSTELLLSSGTSRAGFLRTKKAIAIFVGVGCVIVLAIVLGVVGVTQANRVNSSSGESEAEKQLVGVSSSSVSPEKASTAATSTTGTALNAVLPEASSSLLSTSTFKTQTTSTHPSVKTSTFTTSTTTSTTSFATGSIDVPLRIMALGASIVKGETSPGYLGFRKPMRDQLVDLGCTVNMVGSVRLGDFVDNDVEAYGGKKIKEMHNFAKKAVPRTLPNVFLINLGTNNLLQNKDVDKVGSQMEEMIEYLLTASDRSTVILSTMLTNKVGNLEPSVLDMNRQYRDMAKKLVAAGKPVVLAEMHPSEGVPGVPTADEIGPDGSHPTVQGYETMARVFVRAIQEAAAKGLLQKPADNGVPADGDAERKGSGR
ncbi:carbohydrate esterase family 3 protein [Durotheca rogersii]|uniref:carbohydrate esterase family 3 protein n=1 Tax=Durotheca rogersii TaxID=419775 RepID=UPI002220EEF8|nr:carbohydrate esterase family 3 protein [Durotheca rogersii]KAI5857295.1 carbohydrate esterase family 3 protein [Durotheca rogersii]